MGEVIVLDIDNRKDVYRMKKKEKDKADDEYRMKAKDFDKAMRSALGTPVPSKPTGQRRSSKKNGRGNEAVSIPKFHIDPTFWYCQVYNRPFIKAMGSSTFSQAVCR